MVEKLIDTTQTFSPLQYYPNQRIKVTSLHPLTLACPWLQAEGIRDGTKDSQAMV